MMENDGSDCADAGVVRTLDMNDSDDDEWGAHPE